MSLGAAFRAFFRALKEGESALVTAAAPPPKEAFQASSEPAVQLLALLQAEGRLVDFLMEQVQGFSDAEVGAAARQIHAGCRKVLLERAAFERIVAGAEGSTHEVAPGFDASAIRLLGNMKGAGPWRGTVRHRGWRVTRLSLPTVAPGSDVRVVAPAEVEVV